MTVLVLQFFFQAEDGIRDLVRSRGLGEVYKRQLQSWRATPARQAIIDFVAAVTDANGPRYVPPPDRVAVFDNDGTLWCEQPVQAQADFILRRLAAMAASPGPPPSPPPPPLPAGRVLKGRYRIAEALGAAGLSFGTDFYLYNVTPGGELATLADTALFELAICKSHAISTLDIHLEFEGLLGDRFTKTVNCIPRAGELRRLSARLCP